MLLTGDVFDLRDPGEGVVVGIVDDRDRLMTRGLEGFELELERPVRQLAETEVEVLVDGTGEHDTVIGDRALDLAVVGVQQDLDVRMGEHALEHPGEAVRRHHLIGVGEIAIVAIGPDRDSCDDRRVELGRIEAPLLARVVPEELLVELAPNLADDDVFRRADHVAWFGDGIEELLQLERRVAGAVQPVDGVEVDRYRHQLAVDPGADPVLVVAARR